MQDDEQECGEDSQELSNNIAQSTTQAQGSSGGPLSSPIPVNSILKKNVGVVGFSNTEISANGFRCVDWGDHARDMSAIHAPECAPSAPRMPKIVGPKERVGDDEGCPKPPKDSMLRKFKSSLKLKAEYAAPATFVDESPTLGLTSPHTPRHPTKLRHEISLEDIDKKITGDPFLDGACQETPVGVKVVNGRIATDDHTRRFNGDLQSPTREDKRSTHVPSSSYLSGSDSTQVEEHAKQEYVQVASVNTPALSITPSSSPSTSAKRSPAFNFPGGPDHPDWDHAVSKAKKFLKEEEKKEVEAARKQQKELKAEEKKLKKLKAGKDVVKRGSQLGLTPSKPLDKITEHDFETVGAAATTPEKELPTSKKSGLLGGFFTKMPGSKEEQEKQAQEIDMQLDKHTSLQLLGTVEGKNVNEPAIEDRTHYDKALRLLHGDGYKYDGLVTPFEFERSNDNDVDSNQKKEQRLARAALEGGDLLDIRGETSPIGLGITSAEQDQLATRNHFMAGTRFSQFIKQFVKQRQNAVATKSTNNVVYERPAVSDIPEEETDGPNTVILGETGESCTDSTRGMSLEEVAQHVNRPKNPYNAVPSKNSSSWASTNDLDDAEMQEDDRSTVEDSSSAYSTDEVDEIQTFSGLSGPHHPDSNDFAWEVDRYLDFEGDVAFESLHSGKEIIPKPLKIQKRNFGNDQDTASECFNKPNMDAVPAPLGFPAPFVRVKRSSQNLQSVASNSFIPKRSKSFIRKISEASQLKQAELSSHPALRDLAGRDYTATTCLAPELSGAAEHPSGAGFSPRDARIDSGIGMPAADQSDEGYATGTIHQNAFTTEQGRRPSSTKVKVSKGAQKWRANAADEGAAEEEPDVKRNSLRTEVGLASVRYASEGSLRHPNHPYVWTHEKVMCRFVHNPTISLPQMPQLPQTGPISLGRLDSQYFNSSPVEDKVRETKMCEICGSFCCRYVNLLVTSNINSGGDIMEEMVRTKAKKRVDMLKTCYPNGVEEYETFITCDQCGHQVCPKCASKCNDAMCQSIVCEECSAGAEVCPVHNVF